MGVDGLEYTFIKRTVSINIKISIQPFIFLMATAVQNLLFILLQSSSRNFRQNLVDI